VLESPPNVYLILVEGIAINLRFVTKRVFILASFRVECSVTSPPLVDGKLLILD